MRDDVSLFALPVIVLAESASPEAWMHAYAQGADDVVLRRDAGAVTRRLLTVQRARGGERPEASLGRAVIASQDDASRRRIGRTLRSVGFDRITFERHDCDICIGRSLAESIEFAMALGPAGEVMRLAGAEAERLRPQVTAALTEALAPFVRPDGVFAPSSTWFITATNPG